MTRIAIIDPQFDEIADIEAEVAGPGIEFDILRPGEGAVSAEALAQADAVINCRSRHMLPAPLIEQMQRARIVVQAGVGFNHIDIEACARRGIPVCNTPDYGTMEVADHAIGLVLSLMRGITAYHLRLLARDDAWNTRALPVPPVRRLATQVFGIIGLGRIGTAVALRARAFNMQVMFFDPYVPPGQELALGLRRAATLQDLLGQSDIVSLHCPLNARTQALIDDKAVARMRPGTVLINTARGGIIDLGAVESGLRSGQICAAGLDVLPTEPPDRTHPLIAAWTAQEAWLEGRLTLTPHAAFFTPESLADMRRLSMRVAVEFLRDGRLRGCVNLRELERAGFNFDQ
jgi:lactate dehydrogenase-like 2-hydroxyacid dehydrogenase